MFPANYFKQKQRERRRGAIVAVVIGLVFLGTAIPWTATYEKVGAQRVEAHETTIEDILDALALCESSNNEKAWNKNDGGTPSIGLYQFKVATWEWATKRYGFVGLDIMNGEHQRQVARHLLHEGRWKHWYACLKDIME